MCIWSDYKNLLIYLHFHGRAGIYRLVGPAGPGRRLHQTLTFTNNYNSFQLSNWHTLVLIESNIQKAIALTVCWSYIHWHRQQPVTTSTSKHNTILEKWSVNLIFWKRYEIWHLLANVNSRSRSLYAIAPLFRQPLFRQSLFRQPLFRQQGSGLRPN